MMAKAYVCDACGLTIKDPYRVKMKEFYVGMDICLDIALPRPSKRRVQVELCDECYHALHEIAKEKADNGNV